MAGYNVLSALHLTQFRNYDQLVLTDLAAGPIVFYGHNGAGKTNILEAISLLAPGRGLRKTKTSDFKKWHTSTPWGVHYRLQDHTHDTITIGTGVDPQNTCSERRIIKINGENRQQNTLRKYTTLLWVTPEMDRLLGHPKGIRRKFLDELVTHAYPQHTQYLNFYEKACRERLTALYTYDLNNPVLDSLEHTVVAYGVMLSSHRWSFINQLNQFCQSNPPLPHMRLVLSGFEEHFNTETAIATEQIFLEQLKESRLSDKTSNMTHCGPHRTDFKVWHNDKNCYAEYCSSGEQKLLLIALFLSLINWVEYYKSETPILLLDDIAAHFDQNVQNWVYEMLITRCKQTFISATDKQCFSKIIKQAQFFQVDKGFVANG